jgi:hypothetical protein
MAERTGEDAAAAAFTDLADALERYLNANGWTVAVVGSPRIQQPLGERPFNYEFVVRFTGGRKKEAGADLVR